MEPNGSINDPDVPKWLSSFGGRVCGAELTLPTHEGHSNSRESARSLYILALRKHAQHVLDEFEELLPLFEPALTSPDMQRAAGKEPLRKSSYQTRLYTLYEHFITKDGSGVEIVQDEGPATFKFIAGLAARAEKYHLEGWIVRQLLGAYFAKIAMPGLPFGNSMGQMHHGGIPRLKPEIYRYDVREYAEVPEPTVLEQRNQGAQKRAFEFAHEGYDPTWRRRADFERYALIQFRDALRDYMDRVERDHRALGFVDTPRVRKSDGFRLAIYQRVLGMPVDEIIEMERPLRKGKRITPQAVSEAVKTVEILIGEVHNRTYRRAKRGHQGNPTH